MELVEAASLPVGQVLKTLDSTPAGLAAVEASRRLQEHGPNAVRGHGARPWRVLLRQVENSLLILLVATASRGGSRCRSTSPNLCPERWCSSTLVISCHADAGHFRHPDATHSLLPKPAQPGRCRHQLRCVLVGAVIPSTPIGRLLRFSPLPTLFLWPWPQWSLSIWACRGRESVLLSSACDRRAASGRRRKS